MSTPDPTRVSRPDPATCVGLSERSSPPPALPNLSSLSLLADPTEPRTSPITPQPEAEPRQQQPGPTRSRA
eukprot:3276731-Rhodomonas_salina.2